MHKSMRGLFLLSASLLLALGINAGMPKAYASMPDPEYYHSTRYKDNIYYNIKFGNMYGKHQTRNYYGQMPTAMKQRNHIFGLYYGHRFNKQFASLRDAKRVSQPLYRNHQTYLPDYVYYAMPHTNVRIHNKKGAIYQLYINKRDIGKPYKNQVWADKHAKYFKSLKYHPAKYVYHKPIKRNKKSRIYKHKHNYKRVNHIHYYRKHHKHAINYYWNHKHYYYRLNNFMPKKFGLVNQLVDKAERLGKFPKSVTNQKLTRREVNHIRKENYRTINEGGSFKLHGEKADLAYQIMSEMSEDGGYHSLKAELKGDDQATKQNYEKKSPKATVDSTFWEIGGSSATDPSTHSPNQVIQNCEHEIKIWLMADLNQDHASVGESNLTRYSDLDNVAQERSHQIVNDFNHYDSNGNPYVYDDGLSSDDWAENIAYTGGASFKLRAKHKYDRTAHNDNECQRIANQLNQELFYDEKAKDGGHYQNICDNYNVGLGVTIEGQMVYVAEDFD